MISKKDIALATKEIREFNPKDKKNPLAIAAQTELLPYYACQIRNEIELAIQNNNYTDAFKRVLSLAAIGEAHRLSKKTIKPVKPAKKKITNEDSKAKEV